MNAREKPDQIRLPHRSRHTAEPARDTRAAESPTPHPAHLSPGVVSGLQRSIGNATVARMLTDRHEHEAGCCADGQHPVQRSAVQDVLRSSGRPLDGSTRADMESRLGADFSDVRVHTDAVAQRSTAEIGARAYTSGSHVVIGEGGGDQHTLAHELVHVVQQRSGPVAGTDNGAGLSVSDPSDRFEREAEATATRVMSRPAGESASVQTAPATPNTGAGQPVQRMEGLETEVAKRVKNKKGGKVPGDTDLAESKTADFKVVSDSRSLDDGGSYSNVEFVTGAVQVVGSKAATGPDELDRLVDEIKRVRDEFYGAAEGTLIRSFPLLLRVLPTGRGVTLSSEGYTESAGQEGEGDGLFVHYSIGVPLAGMPLFFDRMREDAAASEQEPALPRAQHRLVQAKQFAAQEVSRFEAAAQTGAKRRRVDTDALDGYLQLCYTQIAAVADYLTPQNNMPQIKNLTVFLSRAPLTSMYRLLDADAQGYLRNNDEAIIDRLASLQERTEDPAERLEFREAVERQVGQLDAVSLETYAKSALRGEPDLSQQQLFGGMREIEPHEVEGATVVPMEIRTIGNWMKTWGELKAELRKIANWAQEAYQKDREIYGRGRD